MKEPVRWLDDPESAPDGDVLGLLRSAAPPSALPEDVRARTARFVVELKGRPRLAPGVLVAGGLFAVAAAVLLVALPGGRREQGEISAVGSDERRAGPRSTPVLPQSPEQTSLPGQIRPEPEPSSTVPVRRVPPIPRSRVVTVAADAGPAPAIAEAETVGQLTPQAISRVVRRGHSELSSCFEANVAGMGPSATPRLEVYLTIGARGDVRHVSVRGDGSPALHTCIEAASRGWEFPASTDGASTSFPVIFQATSFPEGTSPTSPVDLPRTEPGRGADAGEGRLFINSIPWARVYLDGSDTHRNTPIADLPVPAGNHVLTLVTGNGERHQELIRVAPGETLRITRRF